MKAYPKIVTAQSNTRTGNLEQRYDRGQYFYLFKSLKKLKIFNSTISNS
jgi:hypothetical protein